MAIEIERKFLIADDRWKASADSGEPYRQGYLCLDPQRTVRVRIAGNRGFLTVKGASSGPARLEFEYPIPLTDAEELLALCGESVVEKVRYLVAYAGRTWEVDEFSGGNAGLILAEIELERVDQPVELPPWAGREVTGDHRYSNASLARRPYARWWLTDNEEERSGPAGGA